MKLRMNEPIQQKINSLDIHNWTFNTTGFEKAHEDWQKFYRVCRSTELQTNQKFTFPIVQGTFRVRACYDDLYSKVWTLAMDEDLQILITGQAGTGKTVALWYLIRVSSARQINHLFTWKTRSHTSSTTERYPTDPQTVLVLRKSYPVPRLN
ncbi:hypothetical protein E1B28_009948 [Marasmius oreades]|uniref:Uncharacterized protein n=1 Tax=Marasmius oreades TaxID=181124 RepID=A0A9P7RW89_9AGAR|nr:uncharacterized protein E1B28_009948 [Marasmius oreades]KAG7090867.1 hypothetical protein E1B28_009948 [Marasmius oreades]